MIADPEKQAIKAPPPQPLPARPPSADAAAHNRAYSPQRRSPKRLSPLKSVLESPKRQRRSTSASMMLDGDSDFADDGQADNEHSPKQPSPLKSVHLTPERKRRSTSQSIVLDGAGDPAQNEQAGSKRLRYYKQLGLPNTACRCTCSI